MSPKFINTRPELSLEDILLVEQEIDSAIPAELKSHLLIYNGGFPIYNVFKKEGEEYVVNNFLSIKYGLVTLEKIVKIIQTNPTGFPSWLLPFANDAGGNHFCISLKKEDYGCIYFWDHEIAYDSSEQALVFLSKSLDEFLNSLKEEDD